MDVTLVVTVGGEPFALDSPSLQEVREVKRWTGFPSKGDWFSAIIREDADALLAAYVIAKRRKGDDVSFDDAVDFPADAPCHFVDGAGRKVEPAFEKKPDGTLLVDKKGEPVPVLDEEGRRLWRDADTGNVVPFETTTLTSATSPEPGSSGESDSGTPRIAVV